MKIKTNISMVKLLITLLVTLTCYGCCASSLDFSLNEPKGTTIYNASTSLPVKLGVDKFVDLRPQLRGSDNKKWLGFIPGVLWVEIDTDIPELYTGFSPFNSKPFDFSIARAIYYDLKQTNSFKDIVFLPQDPYQKVDFRLEGILKKSLIKETGYYYGSSMYAWLTRIFGLPYVSYDISLVVELRLRNLQNNKIFWHGIISGEVIDKYHSVYDLAKGRKGKHIIAYDFSSIIDKSLKKLIPQMLQAIKTQINKKYEQVSY